jgi:hypothetical protein
MGANTGNVSSPEEMQRMRAQKEAVLNQRGAASMFPGVEPASSGIEFGPGRSRRLEGNR